ncbi:hypothetical protein BY996DRAFT_6623254 [Phakopsora pachyrhizi]|nr:hypothetical protein BY996DRAFT_6623254 [Phakopsora pachyrhizi]
MQEHGSSDDDHRNFLLPKNGYQDPTASIPPGSYSTKGKESQSQDLSQSPHSGIQTLKSKERQYQNFEESLDGDKNEDKILNPEVSTTSPRRSGLRYEGLLMKRQPKDFDTVGLMLTVKSSKPNRNVYLKLSQGGVNLVKARTAENTSSSKRTGCSYEVIGLTDTHTQDKIGQDKTGQDKTRNRTGQDKTKQDTRQDKMAEST